ncbi:purine NTPase, putative [Legionella wadsworthii]|uniref:Purine NTPase, putative n=1 Tax=Legionella wadsworthii TaxID=28088 RepID=A0A378LW59_9GAMM|nr:hypothetical protein [Legionella wadsworthii]STY30181.1 purine NTPase, putative [Legionella wadsworthii]
MLSKTELFKRWRGSLFDSEQHVLKSVLLISDYIDSVEDIEDIQTHSQQKYNDFNIYKARAWGTAAFVKLIIDEALAVLPETAKKERVLLADSSKILSSLYHNWKVNTKVNVQGLIENMGELISLDSIPFPDKKQLKQFLFSSYMFLHIAKIALSEIENTWKAQLINYFVDLQQIKNQLDYFMQKIEEKMVHLKHELSLQNNRAPDPLQAAKDLLCKRYVKVLGLNSLPLKKNPPIQSDVRNIEIRKGSRFYPTEKPMKNNILENLTLLEEDIERVSSGIFSLIKQRNKKEELESKIEALNTLLASAEANDTRITGRKYFIDFIEDGAISPLFQTLLENAEEQARIQFLEKIKHLKSIVEAPHLTTEVLNGVSWVTTPITVVYRTATPQLLQNMITTTLPSTLDGICKEELKTLVNACLLALHNKLKEKESRIAAINNRFFNQDEELKIYMVKESSEKLVELQEANNALREAVISSRRLLTAIKENSIFLQNLKTYSHTLSEFIFLHNNWLVKISNYLARFFSFFKTQTAKMIDDAAVWKDKVDALATEYQAVVEQGIQKIEHIPHLDATIKTHIKNQFRVEERKLRLEKQNNINPHSRYVRLLMSKLPSLFAAHTSSDKEKKVEVEQEAEKMPLNISNAIC